MQHDSGFASLSPGRCAAQAQANKHGFIILGIDSHRKYNWHEAYAGTPATDDYYHTRVRARHVVRVTCAPRCSQGYHGHTHRDQVLWKRLHVAKDQCRASKAGW